MIFEKQSRFKITRFIGRKQLGRASTSLLHNIFQQTYFCFPLILHIWNENHLSNIQVFLNMKFANCTITKNCTFENYMSPIFSKFVAQSVYSGRNSKINCFSDHI